MPEILFIQLNIFGNAIVSDRLRRTGNICYRRVEHSMRHLIGNWTWKQSIRGKCRRTGISFVTRLWNVTRVFGDSIGERCVMTLSNACSVSMRTTVIALNWMSVTIMDIVVSIVWAFQISTFSTAYSIGCGGGMKCSSKMIGNLLGKVWAHSVKIAFIRWISDDMEKNKEFTTD